MAFFYCSVSHSLFWHTLRPCLSLLLPVSLNLSLPLFTQLGLMEEWPNDKDPGEQTHLDSPPVTNTSHIHTRNTAALHLIQDDETN